MAVSAVGRATTASTTRAACTPDGENIRRSSNLTAANYSLWPMPSGLRLRLTVPAKCGTTRWTQLMIVVSTGRMPQPPHGFHTKAWLESHGFDANRLRPCVDANLVPRTMWLLIVRNPYERLLSCFLDKIARPHRPDFVLHYKPHGVHVRPNRTPTGFAEFVSWFAQRPAWEQPQLPQQHGGASPYHRDMNLYAKLHLWPISRSPSVHVQDALWSLRSKAFARAYGRATVVKLEATASWLPSVVKILGLRAPVLHREWSGGCFFRSVGETCTSALLEELQEPRGGQRGGGGGFRQPRPRSCDDVLEQQVDYKTPDAQHNTSACRHLHEFYSSAVAAQVTRLMAPDLSAFKYPVWKAERGTWPW